MGSFEVQLEHLAAVVAAEPDDVPLTDALRLAVLDFQHSAPQGQPWHRRRLSLILSTPALQAHSTTRYMAWRDVITDYVSRRLSLPEAGITVQTIGYTALAAANAA